MPYVAPSEALNAPHVDVQAIRARLGRAPWRTALLGSAYTRWVMIAWPPGFRSVPHHHPHAVESFFILDGQATFDLGASEYSVGPGSLLSAPPGTRHTIEVTGPQDLVFLAAITPNEDRPDETVLP